MRRFSVTVTALVAVAFTAFPTMGARGQIIGDPRSPGSIVAGSQSPGSIGIRDTYSVGGNYSGTHNLLYPGSLYWPGYGYRSFSRRPGFFPFGFGYGYRRYRGFRISTPGYLFRSYTGPAYAGPLINRPVLSPFVYSYGLGYGYGNSYYGGGWPYGTSILAPNPVNNQRKQQEVNNAWRKMRREVVQRAVNQREQVVAAQRDNPDPTTAAEQAKSVRLQVQGDAAFKNENWRQAFDLYRQAADVDKDNGTAVMKMGYAALALGQFSDAVEYFKQALKRDPILARTGPPATEMYGQARLAWSKHLGRLTDWVDANVRDSDRVLLLGIVLSLNGDPRADELLTDAWQLSGGKADVVKILLNPPSVLADPLKVPLPPAPKPPPAPATGNPAAEGPILPDR